MKREIALGVLLLFLLSLCIGCVNVPTQASSQSELLAEGSRVETQQGFPPDYSNAEAIKITIYGGTAKGQSFIVKCADDSMMWNREELPISHDSNGTPYLPAISFNFKSPKQELAGKAAR